MSDISNNHFPLLHRSLICFLSSHRMSKFGIHNKGHRKLMYSFWIIFLSKYIFIFIF